METLSNFNPRSHEGSDDDKKDTQKITVISIHAPTKGATMLTNTGVTIYNNFNPRSHEGSDDDKKDTQKITVISIHAPTKGATLFESVCTLS